MYLVAANIYIYTYTYDTHTLNTQTHTHTHTHTNMRRARAHTHTHTDEIIRDLVASEEGVTTGGYGHPPGSVSRDVVGNERPSALIMHKDSLAFATTQQDKKKKTLDETGIRKRQCPSTSALKKKNHCAGVL